MYPRLKNRLYHLLRWSERYTNTDMLYVFQGGFWLTVGQVATTGGSLLLSIAFANFLDPASYGFYRYVLSAAAILTLPTLTGLNSATVQAVARGNDGVLVPNVRTKIAWGVAGSIASVLAATYYYHASPTSPLASCFLIAALFLPFMDSFGLYDAFLQGKKDFRRSSLYMIAAQFASSAVIALAVIGTGNLLIAVAAYFGSWTVARLVLLEMTVREYRPPEAPDPKVVRYGKHLTIMNILGTIARYADQILVFHFLGATSLAIYSFALSPVDQIKAVLKGAPALALPKLSALSPNEISARLDRRFWFLTLSAGLLATLAYIAIAPFVYAYLFPVYRAAIPFSELYAVTLVFLLPIQIFGAAYSAKPEFLKASYIASTSANLFLLAAIVVLGYFFGIVGVLAARILQNIYSIIASTLIWHREVRAS